MNKVYKKDTFETMARAIHKNIDELREEKNATIIGISISEDDELTFNVIKSNKDVYTLLESNKVAEAIKKENYDLIALLTAGWAAPVNSDNDEYVDVPPSEHPDRRRVKMTIVGNTSTQYASILSMAGEDEDMFDYMGATGTLASAFADFMSIWRGDE